MIGYTVTCRYDVGDGLYFPNIYNVSIDDFSKVQNEVFLYSNKNHERFGTFCIPVLYTPEETRQAFPQFVESNTQQISITIKAWDTLSDTSPDNDNGRYDKEFAMAA